MRHRIACRRSRNPVSDEALRSDPSRRATALRPSQSSSRQGDSDVTGSAARMATKAEFHKMAPQVEDATAKTWITRGGNFAVAVSEVEAGAVLARANDPEEHMVIV